MLFGLFQTLPNQPGTFYNTGLLSTWYPTSSFPAFTPNVIPAENPALFQQQPYKPPGSGRGGNGGPHNQFGKPRRGRGGPGSLSGDRMPNDQRYQNNYQPYQTGSSNSGGSQQPQPYYHSSYRGNSRSSWDGGNSVKKPYHNSGANGGDQQLQQQHYTSISVASQGQLPVVSVGQTPVTSASAPMLPPTTSQATQYNHTPAAPQQVEAVPQQLLQQQVSATPVVSVANTSTASVPAQSDTSAAVTASSTAAPVTSSTPIVPLSSVTTSHSSNVNKVTRNHEDHNAGTGNSYHMSNSNAGYSSYHHKSSMESLHSRDGR